MARRQEALLFDTALAVSAGADVMWLDMLWRFSHEHVAWAVL